MGVEQIHLLKLHWFYCASGARKAGLMNARFQDGFGAKTCDRKRIVKPAQFQQLRKMQGGQTD